MDDSNINYAETEVKGNNSRFPLDNLQGDIVSSSIDIGARQTHEENSQRNGIIIEDNLEDNLQLSFTRIYEDLLKQPGKLRVLEILEKNDIEEIDAFNGHLSSENDRLRLHELLVEDPEEESTCDSEYLERSGEGYFMTEEETKSLREIEKEINELAAYGENANLRMNNTESHASPHCGDCNSTEKTENFLHEISEKLAKLIEKANKSVVTEMEKECLVDYNSDIQEIKRKNVELGMTNNDVKSLINEVEKEIEVIKSWMDG